ncbi:MAG: hypothetical protein K6D02_01535, partial [Lachnospiraceae bacterium]|nr:hypothetical protein [Lachnospiraceae bacterium]
MDKNKNGFIGLLILPWIFIITLASSISMFRFTIAVSRKRNKNSKPELKRKKHWFQLKHIKNNHPTVEYENEYYTGK